MRRQHAIPPPSKPTARSMSMHNDNTSNDNLFHDQLNVALNNNPHVPQRTLRFEASEGRVTLRGIVGTFFQKQMAQEAIRRVVGVREIANELEVCS